MSQLIHYRKWYQNQILEPFSETTMMTAKEETRDQCYKTVFASPEYKWADPTNAVIGGDNNQTRSPWGVQVKWLTKICWQLIAPPSNPDLLGLVGLNLAFGLVTYCWGCQMHVGDLHAVSWGEGPWALVTSIKAIVVGVGLILKVQMYLHLNWSSIIKSGLGQVISFLLKDSK